MAINKLLVSIFQILMNTYVQRQSALLFPLCRYQICDLNTELTQCPNRISDHERRRTDRVQSLKGNDDIWLFPLFYDKSETYKHKYTFICVCVCVDWLNMYIVYVHEIGTTNENKKIIWNYTNWIISYLDDFLELEKCSKIHTIFILYSIHFLTSLWFWIGEWHFS